MKEEEFDESVYENMMIPTPVGDFYTVPYRGLLVADVRNDADRFKDATDVLRFLVQHDPRRVNHSQKLIRNGAGDPIVFLQRKVRVCVSLSLSFLRVPDSLNIEFSPRL